MRERRERDERGAVLVLVAAMMAALAVLVAIIVDVGGARRDRDADQVAADAMALAAAGDLTRAFTSARPACLSAWAYLTVNLPTGASQPPPSCSVFNSPCQADVPRRVEVTVDAYTIAFVHPVPDEHDLMEGQPADAVDGSACDRFGVEVHQSRANLVADGTVEISVDAVARLVRGVGDVQAPLVLLDPTGCEVLNGTGNATLTVTTADGTPGYINIDSDASECGPGNSLVLNAAGKSTIHAGTITMWALAGEHASKAYDDDSVDFDLQNPQISPAPVASSAPVGRSGMDWRYNCKPENGCPDDRPPYLDELIATHQPEPPNPVTPAGYTRWTDVYGSCSLGADLAVPAGDWHIDCPSGLSTNRKLTFQGGDIVADHAISVSGSNGALRVNCATSATASCPTAKPASPSIYYIRSGDLARNSDLELHETFVYLQSGGADLAGNGDLVWTAPDDPEHPFDALALWTEQTSPLKLRGSTTMELEGILFAPNAQVDLSGNVEGNALGAQIFAKSMNLAGGADVTLAPREDRMLMLGRGRSLLIR